MSWVRLKYWSKRWVSRLHAGQPSNAFRFPAETTDLSLLQSVHVGSGAQPFFYSMAARFPGVKRRKQEAVYLLASSTQVRNEWDYISTYPYAFISYTRNPFFTFTQKPKVWTLTSLVGSTLEYEVACWDPRKGQINELDQVKIKLLNLLIIRRILNGKRWLSVGW
jgi:hypothetical protein